MLKADEVSAKQEVVDIEESVWAPRLGLKGNIDASLRIGTSAAPQPQQGGMQTWLQGGPAGGQQGGHGQFQQQQQQSRQQGKQQHGQQRQQGGPGQQQQQQQQRRHPWQAGQQQPHAQQQPPHEQQQPRWRQQVLATPVQQALAPFEFKTGRPHHSHRAQVYTLGTLTHLH